jgi:hypothetical protein
MRGNGTGSLNAGMAGRRRISRKWNGEEAMPDATNLDAVELTVGDLKTNRCKQRFKIFSDYMKGFGDKFDDLDFLNYQTGNVVKGAELRDAQTGCEIYEKLGWDSAAHNSESFHKCGCNPHDEQLRFVSADGEPLSNTDYIVTIEDGRTVSGTTDDDGKTKRIRSVNKEQSIEKVEFVASERIQPLCPRKRIQPGKKLKHIKPAGIVTNKVNVGSSVKTVTLEGNACELTPGEIKMCRPIVKDSIFYSEVRIHNSEWLPFGMQPDDTAMSPNGEIFFPTATYQEDFSTAQNPKDKIWFMHEMAHVWQWNRGYRGRLKGKGAFYGFVSWSSDRGYRWVYEYYSPENKDKKFSEFNMEQQAEILSHYFGAKYLMVSQYQSRLEFLEKVLHNFLKEPRFVALLPDGTM